MSWLPPLPPGFDADTRLALLSNNTVIAVHPQHPPHILNEKALRWEPVAVNHQ